MSPMKLRHWHTSRYGALLLLWVFFAQVALAARETSITLDEPLHIASGYACLVTGDYRLVEEHPPLLKMLQAAPLLLATPRLPDLRTVPGWDEGDLITVAQHAVVPYRPIDPLVIAARVPTMLVGVLLGALIFRWTCDLTGKRSYLPMLAVYLFAFDPNMLAHAGVAATDLGAAAGMCGALYTYWRWLRRPSYPRALVAALLLGVALGVKNTALMLGPIYAILLLWECLHRRTWKPYLIQGMLIAAGAFLCLWAVYRFEFGMAPGIPFPIPAPSHLLPLRKLQQHMQDGHAAFLMGQNYHHGDWRYFPVAFALKTPPLTSLLCGWTLLRGVWLMAKKKAGSLPALTLHASAPLLLFLLLYTAVSLASGINIGYRHLLPMLPVIYVSVVSYGLTGILVATSATNRCLWNALRLTFFGAWLGYAVVTLSLWPWHLAYFNSIAGGPDGGYRYLVDSNLDWGQTWKALRRYLDAKGITEFSMSSYTINDPRAYGLDYTPLPPWPDAPPVMPQRFDPVPGIYAISSTQLQGVVIADAEMFDYFRNLEPRARIGHALFVYEILPHSPATWIAQCSTPVTPLPLNVVSEGFGIDETVSMLDFDCAQSWIIPPGAGRYVLSRDDTGTPWALLAHGRLAFTQKQPGLVPPFAVYEWESITSPQPGYPMTNPSTLDATLTFLGYNAPVLEIGETNVVETWWRAETRPAQSLSLMAHLVREDGVPLAVGDGLGVSVEQWIPGSLLIQRHQFAIPPETSPGAYTLQVGAYTYPDLNRLLVTAGEFLAADHITVGQLEVIAP